MCEFSTAKKNIQNKNRNTPAQMLLKNFNFNSILGPINHFRNMAAIG